MQMAILRSDYMFDISREPHAALKQVEINMIAAGLGGCADKILKLHQSVLSQQGVFPTNARLPENDCLIELSNAFVEAWESYGNGSAGILFVVAENERNVFDQRHMENKIYELNPKIKVVRKTLLEIYNLGNLDKDKKFFLYADYCVLFL